MFFSEYNNDRDDNKDNEQENSLTKQQDEEMDESESDTQLLEKMKLIKKMMSEVKELKVEISKLDEINNHVHDDIDLMELFICYQKGNINKAHKLLKDSMQNVDYMQKVKFILNFEEKYMIETKVKFKKFLNQVISNDIELDNAYNHTPLLTSTTLKR